MDKKSLSRFEELSVSDEKPSINDSSDIDRLWQDLEQGLIDVNTNRAWSRLSACIDQVDLKPKVSPLRWVASAVLIVGLTWIAYSLLSTSEEYLYEARQNHTDFILPDKSSVTLGKGSTLSYASDARVRNVQLVGVAFFNVEENQDLPFKITAGKVKVEVVGTSFEIISDDNYFKIAVKGGEVKVNYGSESWSLVRGDAISIDSDLKAFKRFSNLDDLPGQYFNGDITLNNEQLLKVLQMLSYKHDLDLHFSSSNLKPCLISVKFDLNELHSTLENLSVAVDFSFSIVDNKLEISGKGC